MIEARIIRRNIVLIVKRAGELDVKVLKAIRTGLARGLLLAAGAAESKYLHGPRPKNLGVLSGRLSQSVTTNVSATDGGITGRIGSNVAYAAFHEFGFHGTINISAHTRVLENLDEFGADQDMRRTYTDDQGHFVGYRDTRKQASGKFAHAADVVQFVRAHTRNINYEGRPFIRPAVEVSKEDIGNEIAKELQAI